MFAVKEKGALRTKYSHYFPIHLFFFTKLLELIFIFINILLWYLIPIIHSFEIDPKDTEAALFDKLCVYIRNYCFRGPCCPSCKLLILVYIVMMRFSCKIQKDELNDWITFTLQLELKLGIGGTSYEDFIGNMHLPMQLR